MPVNGCLSIIHKLLFLCSARLLLPLDRIIEVFFSPVSLGPSGDLKLLIKVFRFIVHLVSAEYNNEMHSAGAVF